MHGVRWRWAWFAALVLASSRPCGSAPVSRPLLQDFSVRTWVQADGLPDDSVTAVLQTRDGYLWVGTTRGLVRFDGMKFFPVSAGDRRAEGGPRVTALYEDAGGRLWFGTQGEGLFYYTEGTVRRFPPALLADQTINCLAQDKAGNLWVGTPLGLDRLEHPLNPDPASKTEHRHFSSAEGLPSDFVSSVQIARSGAVWITTRSGICQYRDGVVQPVGLEIESLGRSPEFIGVYEDRQGNLWTLGDTCLVNLAEGNRINRFGSGERIWSLCEGRDRELWIGTSGQGLFSFDGDKFLPLNLRSGRLPSDVRALCEDRDGNLWLGTYAGGLVRLQPRRVRVLETGAGLPGDPITCFALDALGRAWVGFERAGLYGGTTEQFEKRAFSTAAGMPNRISALCVAPDGNLWAGTFGSGLYCCPVGATSNCVRFTTANGLSDDTILALAADAKSNLWIATRSGALDCWTAGNWAAFRTESGLSGHPITALLPRAGGIWLGTDAGELFEMHQGTFTRVNGADALAGSAIRALYEDRDGRLWVGNEGGMLACYAKGRCSSWDAKSVLAAGAILAILSDETASLWLETGRGIFRLPASELKDWLGSGAILQPELVLEAEGSGKSASLTGWPRAACFADGRLWFVMGSSIVTFYRQELAPALAPPPVAIAAVWVNGRRLNPGLVGKKERSSPPAGELLRLPSDLHSVEVEFSAPALTAPEKIRFQHRLETFDSDWVDGGTDRQVRYGRLAPGLYHFRVRASDTAGIWNGNEAGFDFLILVPTWRTWWALSGYSLFAAFLVAVVARVVSHRRLRLRLARLAQAEAMQRERMRIAQDMHDEIGSKLTKISFMSERAKGELTAEAPAAGKLEAIASTSRDLLQALDEIVWAVNPRNDTLEHLAAYLGQYATEYLQNTALECELHIPRGLPPCPVSAEARHNVFLAFEEALNNALKHAQASRVRIVMAADPSELTITLEDNGRGFDPATATSHGAPPAGVTRKRGGQGLGNMRRRLAEIGGRCELSSRPGQGTTVTLKLPLPKHER